MAALTATVNSISLNDAKSIAPNLNLDERIEPDMEFTVGDVVQFLEANCKEFVDSRGNSKITNIHIDNCGKGNGYLSLVLKFRVQFNESPDFRFVFKIPLPNAMSSMIGDGENDGQEVEPEQKLNKEEKEEVDENAKMIIDGHNLECEFYRRFQGNLGDYPMPRVFYTRKIDGTESFTKIDVAPVILMEDLSTENHEILGLWRSGSVAHVYSIAKAIAKFQFYVEKHEENHDSWMLEKNLHLDAFYSSWLPVGIKTAPALGSFSKLLPQIEKICSRKFGHYALREKPKQYGAITICQGDINPFNVFFKCSPVDGHLTNELRAIIDYQILFNANPCFDLARFICCSVDGGVQSEANLRAYEIYYRELETLMHADGKKMKFTYEQGLELFHLALCQQATFIVSFLFFIQAMAANNEKTARNFPNLIKRAEFAVERAIEYIDLYDLNNIEF